ncbi:hypothetical protein BX265_7481 [Streptomyces sp. TLI_235]|nr:hypothetical protein BX265_7481 [Streptomyces sp. TLI_235]
MATSERGHRWPVGVREMLAAGVDLYDPEGKENFRRLVGRGWHSASAQGLGMRGCVRLRRR